MALRFATVGLVSALLVAIAFQPRPHQVTTTTSALLAPPTRVSTTTTTFRLTTTTWPEPEQRPLLAPGWEFIGEGDRVGGLLFGTGEELVVWGGRDFPTAFDDGPFLLTGRAWHHALGTSRDLPPAPFAGCGGTSGSVWTGSELIAWFRPYADPGCDRGMVAAYDPSGNSWRKIEAPEFIEAGTSAIWTGSEVVAWKLGLALDPHTGATRRIEPLDINESHHSRLQAHWTGEQLLVMGSTRLHRYRIESDTWDQLESPPIGVTAQASAWTGDQLLAANYAMDAALFRPESEEWRRIESMPLRFWETIPATITGGGLTMVKMGSSTAVLDGESWVTMPNAAMGWDPPHAEGAMVMADDWIYQVGNFVVRRPLPVVVGGGVQTEDVIPLQTLLFDVPDSWTARLLSTEDADPGYGDRDVYELTADRTRTCLLEAWHGGEPPPLFDRMRLVRSWDGSEMTVGTDVATNLAVVDDSDRTSDWVAIRCKSNQVAQFLASHVWVSP
ncbi:MAG: hypothetical protein ACRDVK_11390 [Acidimicrobiia bacterium]